MGVGEARIPSAPDPDPHIPVAAVVVHIDSAGHLAAAWVGIHYTAGLEEERNTVGVLAGKQDRKLSGCSHTSCWSAAAAAVVASMKVVLGGAIPASSIVRFVLSMRACELHIPESRVAKLPGCSCSDSSVFAEEAQAEVVAEDVMSAAAAMELLG